MTGVGSKGQRSNLLWELLYCLAQRFNCLVECLKDPTLIESLSLQTPDVEVLVLRTLESVQINAIPSPSNSIISYTIRSGRLTRMGLG